MEFLEKVLLTIQDQLDKLHVPYSYGWSIIGLTLFVKIISFPLVKTQVRAAGAQTANEHSLHSCVWIQG